MRRHSIANDERIETVGMLGAIGCYLTVLILSVAFWGLVAYGIWTLIQYIQSL